MIIGIDPGQSGAATAMTRNGDIIDIFTFKDATAADIKEALEEYKHMLDGPLMAYLENVHTMPKQGIASAGKFMRHFGMLEGILVALEIPYELISPQKWQGHLNCRTKGDKNITKAKAQQLWPDMEWTHATSDSALIAEYGRQVTK